MRLLLLLLSVLLFVGCSSSGSVRQGSSGSVDQITSYAKKLIGTPYKYGGNSPKSGFDCSGFVGYVFKNAGGVSLPRTTKLISSKGSSVKRSQLRKGDLVFFDTNNRPYSHVGIYLGNDRFIHAPSSGGEVGIVDMNERYWKKHYNGARRITL